MAACKRGNGEKKKNWTADEILQMIEDGKLSEFEDSEDESAPENSVWKRRRTDKDSSTSEDEDATSPSPRNSLLSGSSVSTASVSVSEANEQRSSAESHSVNLQQTSGANPRRNVRRQLSVHKWKKCNDFVPIFDIRNCSDPSQLGPRGNWTPGQYLQQYIDEKMYSHIARCTKIRSVESKGKSLNLKAQDIKRFFGTTLLMSNLGFPWIRMYWASDTRVPIIADNFTRDKYFAVRSNLKVVVDADIPEYSKETDKLWKVRPFLNDVRRGCLMLQRSSHLSIDEQMIPFTGHTSMKQYVVGKPNPVGLKNFVLATPEGMVLDFVVYQGKNILLTDDSSGVFTVAESAVVKLCETVPPGTCVYFDRYFTTENLLVYLHTKDIYGTGTLMKNKFPSCDFTSDKIMSKCERGVMEQFSRDDEKICVTKWYDKKPVTVMSTVFGKDPTDTCDRWCKKLKKKIVVPRPQCVKQYNKFMGGVDLSDTMISFYRMKARTNKWTVRVLLHFFDLSVTNAWLQYRSDCYFQKKRSREIMKFLQFRMKLAEEMLQNSTADGDVVDEEAPEYEKPANKKRCKLPPLHFRVSGQHMPQFVDLKNPNKCRREGCNGKTIVQCMRCEVYLCLHKGKNCFSTFHGEVLTVE